MADYWERRYVERSAQSTFEWYARLAVYRAPLMEALSALTMRILHVGNGNSTLPEELWALGFRDQHANDISPSVIARMAERTSSCTGLSWAVEDVRSMPHHADGSFDAVVDKGTYDALSCDCLERELIVEARRLLKPGGIYVLISSLESAKYGFMAPRWRVGEWKLRSTHVKGETLVGGSCWVHAAIKCEE